MILPDGTEIIEGNQYNILGYYFICTYVTTSASGYLHKVVSRLETQITAHNCLCLKISSEERSGYNPIIYYQASIEFNSFSNSDQKLIANSTYKLNYGEAFASLAKNLEFYIKKRSANIQEIDLLIERLEPILALETIQDILE